MKILNAGCPRADGFYMPAEYAPHKGTIIIWPKRPGSWIYGARRAREAFAEVICAIAESEQAYVKNLHNRFYNYYNFKDLY